MKIGNRDIFEQIGNLFYAIAAEQQVKPLEIGQLKALINKDWSPRNRNRNQPLVSEETHLINLAMDTQEGTRATPGEAFGEFAKFYNLHPELFTADVKQRILDTAVKITDVFKANHPFANTPLEALKELFAFQNVAEPRD